MSSLLSLFIREDSSGSFPTPREGEFPTPRQGEIVLRKSMSCDETETSSKEGVVSPFDMTFLLDSPASKSSSVNTRNTFRLSMNGDSDDSDNESDNVLLLREEQKGEKIASCGPRSFLCKVRKSWMKVRKSLKRSASRTELHTESPSFSLFPTWRRSQDQSVGHTSTSGNIGYSYMFQNYDEDEDDCILDFGNSGEVEALWSDPDAR